MSDDFGETRGPVFRWFAWRPVKTEDRGWRWLRVVNRRRVTVSVDGRSATWWASSVTGR